MNDARINLINRVKKRYGAIASWVPCASFIFEYEHDPRLEGFRREVFVIPPVCVKLLQKCELSFCYYVSMMIFDKYFLATEF